MCDLRVLFKHEQINFSQFCLVKIPSKSCDRYITFGVNEWKLKAIREILALEEPFDNDQPKNEVRKLNVRLSDEIGYLKEHRCNYTHHAWRGHLILIGGINDFSKWLNTCTVLDCRG